MLTKMPALLSSAQSHAYCVLKIINISSLRHVSTHSASQNILAIFPPMTKNLKLYEAHYSVDALMFFANLVMF